MQIVWQARCTAAPHATLHPSRPSTRRRMAPGEVRYVLKCSPRRWAAAAICCEGLRPDPALLLLQAARKFETLTKFFMLINLDLSAARAPRAMEGRGTAHAANVSM